MPSAGQEAPLRPASPIVLEALIHSTPTRGDTGWLPGQGRDSACANIQNWESGGVIVLKIPFISWHRVILSAILRHSKGLVWNWSQQPENPAWVCVWGCVWLLASVFADLTSPRLRGGTGGPRDDPSLAGSDCSAVLEQYHAPEAPEKFL